MGAFKEIGGATLNYGLGKFVPQIIGFLLIPVYTTYLVPADYGIVELAGAFSTFLMIFMRMALPGSVGRFYYEHKEGPEMRNYVTTIYWSLIVLSIAVGLITFIISYFFIDILVPGLPFWPFILIVILTCALSANSDIQKRLLQARKQSRYSALLSIITAGVGITAAIIMVVVFRLGALGMILASFFSAIVFFIQAQFYLQKDMGGKFSWTLLKPSLRYALNILPSHFVSPFGNLFSRSLLAGISLSAVGVFSLANRFVSPLLMLADAFNHAYIPIYFEIRKKNEPDGVKRLNDVLKNFWTLTQVVFVGTAVFFPLLIKLLTPASYHGAAELVPYMTLIFPLGVLTSFVSVEIYYSTKTYWVSIYAVFKFIIYITVVYFSVPKFGSYGLVLAMVTDGAYAALFHGFVSHSIHKTQIDYKRVLLLLLISMVFVAFSVYMGKIIANVYYVAGINIGVFALFILLLWGSGWLKVASVIKLLKRKKN